MHILDDLSARGFVADVTDRDALKQALSAGPVTFYAGYDPTSPSLHVGNLVVITLQARLQRAGHKAAEKPDCDRTGGGMAVQVPQPRVQQGAGEGPEPAVLAHAVVAGEEFSESSAHGRLSGGF